MGKNAPSGKIHDYMSLKMWIRSILSKVDDELVMKRTSN